jgi:purine-cytosine permease-like protein
MRLADDPAKEDYSLRYTPSAFRQWRPWQVWITAIGSLAAMAGYSLAGSFALGYGVSNAITGYVVAAVIVILTAIPIAYAIADKNIDIDLLTRGTGFGYFGSTITSLVYATFTLIFVAFEGSIMAQAVTALTHIPIRISYVIVSIAIIPLVVYGMRFTAKFQTWTQPIWVALLLTGIIAVLVAPGSIHGVTALHPPVKGGTALTVFGLFAVAAAQMSGAAQSGEQGDYLRFMPDRTPENRRAWWTAVIFGGPGMMLIFTFAFLAGLLLTGYALPRVGVAAADEPVMMFDQAYARLFGHNEIALVLAAALVILSQLKINIMNAYSGSLSWSNFFSRILHRHPGRVVWLFLQVALGLVIMEANVFAQIDKVLDLYANLAVAWIGCIVADLVFNKKLLKLSPPLIEFKRAHLYNFNPVGFGSMLVATAVSFTAYFGAFGGTAKAMSAFISLAIALVLPPIVAWATHGKYYIARTSDLPDGGELTCVKCAEAFDVIDMAACPFHEGTICSLCCSTEGKCHDVCKKPAGARDGAGPVPLGMPVRRPQRAVAPVLESPVLMEGEGA